MLLGVPGTRVIAPHHRFDPATIYERLLSDAVPALPTIAIENKILYGEKASAEAVEGFKWFHSAHDFPISYLRAEGRPDATIVCYGGMLPDVEKAVDRLFMDHDVVAEAICPIQLYPLQRRSMLPLAERSGRLLLVEEGQGFCGLDRRADGRVLRDESRAQDAPTDVAAAAYPFGQNRWSRWFCRTPTASWKKRWSCCNDRSRSHRARAR